MGDSAMTNNKPSIKKVVKALLKLQDIGESGTLLGIGPMSSNLLQASFELGRDLDFPLMFIASRNQVDLDELGGGYVNNWNQQQFAQDICQIATSTGFNGIYYLCRDHGGPWQRDAERNMHLSEDEAMALARQSYLADMIAGFDLLMIDPTKDPYQVGKEIPLDIVLHRTVDLIEWCETERRKRGLPEIGYEVGTEETNGGLTSPEKYQTFIDQLAIELDRRQLPMPTFIVGQTGTLIRQAKQVGHFDFKAASELSKLARQYGVGLKEHNGDYLDDIVLMEHIPSHVLASNVAPMYGTEETKAYISLCKFEEKLIKDQLIAPTEKSNLIHTLLIKALETGRCRKWTIGNDSLLTNEEVLANKQLSKQVLATSGHYVFNDDEVRREITRLYSNLSKVGINGKRFIINRIKRSLQQYVEAYCLEGITTRINNVIN